MFHPQSKVTIHHNISKVKPNMYNTIWVFNREKRFLNTNPLVYVFVSQPGNLWL